MPRLRLAARIPAIALIVTTGAVLAACAPAGLPPLPSGILATATPVARASAAPASGVPAGASPSPSSAASTAVAVLANARAFAADGTLSFRVTFTGVSRHTTDILDVKGTLDVDGTDAALKATVDFPRGGLARTAYRRVGDSDWFQFDKDPWKTVKGVAPGQMVEPFAGLRDGGTVQYLGEVDGEPGHYLVETTGMYMHPVLIPARNLTDEKVRTTKLRLVVDADGRPVRATWNMDGTGRVSGQLQAVSIDLELSYSRWGSDLTITRP
ncbi:MAG TPA: hypothetical protein VGK16_08285 [Candidatus Limnocylindrales bacterium]